METQQLRHLCSIVEHGNFARAAEALGVTQPGLSHSIHALEKTLGVKVFDRTSRGVTLTAFGAELLIHARAILNTQQRAQLILSAMREGEKERLRIGVAHSFADFYLPLAATALLSQSAQIGLSVQREPYTELLRLLRVGDIDVALTLVPPAPDESDDIVIHPLIEMRSAILASTEHPYAGRSNVTLEELRHARWVVWDEAQAIRVFLDNFVKGDRVPPPVTVKTNAMPFFQGMLYNADTLGASVDQLHSADIVAGKLTVINTELPQRTVLAAAIYCSGKSSAFGGFPTEAVQLLIGHLERIVTEHGALTPRGARATTRIRRKTNT